MHAAVTIDPSLHIGEPDARHRLPTFPSLASHGFVASVGSGSSNVSFVPSGSVTLVTGLPAAFSACLIVRASDGLRLRADNMLGGRPNS